MIGKDHQKTQPHTLHPKDVSAFIHANVKHSIASTAVSGSCANSLMLSQEDTERGAEEAKPLRKMPRVMSSSSIVETVVKALDQLARKNTKSHLLKKYAQLKEKYSKIMENSCSQPTLKNQLGMIARDKEEAVLHTQQKDNIKQFKIKNTKLQTQGGIGKLPTSDYIKFESKNGEQFFEILKYLSEGVSGKVYLVRHLQTGYIFSLKVIPKANIGPLNVHQLVRELKIQSFLSHPNIVRLYHYHIDHTNIYLILEPCLGKDLYNTVKNRKEGLPQREVKEIVRQVCQAVDYMHRRNIIHRDIKPENILLHQDVVKICDFGWAVHSPLLRATRCGTPLYASPEMVREEQYDCKIDVWNIGVLTYELLYGNIPFQIRQVSDLTKIIEQEVYFSSKMVISEYAKEFISGCLEKHPSKRFTIRQASEHQFLANLQKFRWTVV